MQNNGPCWHDVTYDNLGVLDDDSIDDQLQYLLLDVPGAAMGLGAMVLLERGTRSGFVRWWPTLAIPLVCLAAVYIRFGALTNLAEFVEGFTFSLHSTPVVAGHPRIMGTINAPAG